MLVKKWMSKDVVAVDADDSLQQAIDLMKEGRSRLLPVLKDNQLVGVISDGDLKKAAASSAVPLDVQDLLYLTYKTKVRDIMTRNPVTVPLDHTVEEAAQTLLKNNISAAPVVDRKGRVAGIVTRDHVFRVFLSLTGPENRGVQFAFRVKDRLGAVKELLDVIRNNGGRTASVLSTYEAARPGHRNVYVRAFNIDRAKMPQTMKELTEKADLLYMVDHREGRRELFEDPPGA
jgi:acetoin utilization protein AcuB